MIRISQMLLGSAGGLIETFAGWLLYSTTANVQLLKCATDSAGNMYAVGKWKPAGFTRFAGFFIKVDPDGAIVDSKDIFSSPTDSEEVIPYSISLDSNGDYYIAGGWGVKAFLMKFSSLGVFQWSTFLSAATGASWFADVQTDAAGEIHAFGRTVVNAKPSFLLVKFNSGGTVLRQHTVEPPANGLLAQSIALDSQVNAYVVGTYNGAVPQHAVIVKFNSDGSVAATKAFNNTVEPSTLNGACVIGTDLYVGGSHGNGTFPAGILARLPGTLASVTWSKKVSNNGDGAFQHLSSVTPLSTTDVLSSGSALQMRHSIAGVANYKRSLSTSNGSGLFINDTVAGQQDSVFIVAATASIGFAAKLSSKGLGEGTFGTNPTVTYGTAGTVADADFAVSLFDPGFTNAVGTLSLASTNTSINGSTAVAFTKIVLG